MNRYIIQYLLDISSDRQQPTHWAMGYRHVRYTYETPPPSILYCFIQFPAVYCTYSPEIINSHRHIRVYHANTSTQTKFYKNIEEFQSFIDFIYSLMQNFKIRTDIFKCKNQSVICLITT